MFVILTSEMYKQFISKVNFLINLAYYISHLAY